MSRWDIDPAGVQSVVAKTATAFEPMEKHAKAYGDSMKGAATASGSELVAKALAGFAQHHSDTLQGIARRTSRTVKGAVTATNAYLKGDLEMAHEAQRNAAGAHTTPLREKHR